MIKSAYIHIPFCKRKCNYCTFVSYPNLDFVSDYIKALSFEIENLYQNENLETIYFGGGTPSLLGLSHFEKVLSLLNFDKNTEVTVEINPETVDKNYLIGLKNIGVNRLSVGIQDFSDDILELIGRGHTAKTACEIVNTAQEVGFDNISVDLIYGLPSQTKTMFENSLRKAVLLGVQHISLYGLKIEDGCKFSQDCPKNLPSDDNQAEYYLSAINICEENGFEHYEISNFSKKNRHSKHNLKYWNNENYYGFGVSASGYEKNIRYYNEVDLKKYIQNPLKKIHQDILTEQNQLEEEIFLGFRKICGINVSQINKKYGINFEKKYKEPLEKYLNTHILKTIDGYKLSKEGILVSNLILSEFLC